MIVRDTDATKDVYVRGPAIDAASYGYDRLSRLTSVAGPDGARSYAYDPAGNRTAADTGSGAVTSMYDRADRLTAAGATAITVDAAGNLTVKGSDSFAYDQANRLTSATVSGTTETYAYDGDGVRVSRQVGTDPAIRYVSDVAAGLPVTLADGPRKYVWGLGLAYAVDGASVEVYHADRLGSVRALTDASGTIVATYRTDEWGVPTGTTGTTDQPFGFTGEPADATGLTYLRARYYAPELGRFMSQDPFAGFVGTPGSLHRYGYVGNNPTTLADPSGLVSPGPVGPGGRVKGRALGCGGEAHGPLDVGGLLNPLADAANGLIYLCEGDLENAFLSFIFIIPIADLLKPLRYVPPPRLAPTLTQGNTKYGLTHIV